MRALPEWRGHRIFAADGTKINLPHELLLSGYTASHHKDQYYPQGLMSVVYHLGSGLIYDCLLSSDKNERHCIISQMDKLSEGDVLVLDRGYFSYFLLHQAVAKNLHLICRLQFGTMNKDIQAFYDSTLNESIIDYAPSDSVKSEIKKQGYSIAYRTIKLRLIKYKINDEFYICATTLIGENYPLNEFPGVYHARWGIEELYKISKRSIEVEDFHSKTERGVKQEIYAHALLINIARIIELETNKQLPPSKYKGEGEQKHNQLKASYWQDFCDEVENLKINFKHCFIVISRYIEKLVIFVEHESKDWISNMLNSISRVRQKIRRGRHYPRCSRKPYNRWKSTNPSKIVKAPA